MEPKDITYSAESLTVMLRRVTEENLPIEDTAPQIFTPKGQGVLPEYDIRTDMYEVRRQVKETERKLQETERMKPADPSQTQEVTGDTNEGE